MPEIPEDGYQGGYIDRSSSPEVLTPEKRKNTKRKRELGETHGSPSRGRSDGLDITVYKLPKDAGVSVPRINAVDVVSHVCAEVISNFIGMADPTQKKALKAYGDEVHLSFLSLVKSPFQNNK